MANKLTRKEIKNMLRNAEKLPPDEVNKLLIMLQKMPLELSQAEIEAILHKSGKERYVYALKRIAEQKVAWTLKSTEGIIKTIDENGDDFIHIWPYKEYALKCVTGDWENLELLKITLDSLLYETLPNLSKKGIKIAVFKVPNDSFIVGVSADDFLNNLLYECSNYR